MTGGFRSWVPILCMIAGFLLGRLMFLHYHWHVSTLYAPYISVAALAGLDTVFGGIRAGIEGRFQNDIFVSGFLLNTLLAAGLAWLGDHIGLNLALVAVLVLGTRVFLNLSLIRRYYLNKLALAKTRSQAEAETLAAAATGAAVAPKAEPGAGWQS